MKTIQIKTILSTLLIVLIFIFSGAAQTADEILKKTDNMMNSSKDMKGKMKIVLINKSGSQEIREAYIMQKGNDKRLFKFTAPSSQAGIATLSLPGDVMYVYLPSYEKERRISSSVKNQKFAGTDFSYDDMEAVSYSKKYTATLLGSDDKVFRLELKPISPQSMYSKINVNIDKVNYLPIAMEFYDKGNKKIKEASYSYQKSGKYWNAKEIVMKDLKTGHTTKMLSSSVEYDTGLSDDEFTVRKLKE
jgi:outer membrane lipoprotein-sorting protein